MNLVTIKLFSLQTLHYGTIRPTALERYVCPSLWCGYSILAAEWLDLSAVGIAQLSHAAGDYSLPWGLTTRLFPNDFGEDCLIIIIWELLYREITLCIFDLHSTVSMLIVTHTHTHTHTHRFRLSLILSRTIRVSWHREGKTNLDLLEQEIVSGSGISWAICKSTPWPKHITTPVSHHSVFYRLDALPAAQPTASKQWRHIHVDINLNPCGYHAMLGWKVDTCLLSNDEVTIC